MAQRANGESQIGLTPTQEKALEALQGLPTPPAPEVSPILLVDAPLRYRALPWGLGTAGLILLILFGWPLLTVPTAWQGAVALKSGSAVQLMVNQTQAIRLPNAQGILLLHGPAELKLERLHRHLFTGRTEATLNLPQGDLLLSVSSRQPKVILIETPLLAVRVTGTQLLVGHRPGQGSRLVVVEGKVLAKPKGDKRWQPVSSGTVLRVSPAGVATIIATSADKVIATPALSGRKQSPRNDEDALPLLPEADPWRYLWHEQER